MSYDFLTNSQTQSYENDISVYYFGNAEQDTLIKDSRFSSNLLDKRLESNFARPRIPF
jgi:hypothetical protein